VRRGDRRLTRDFRANGQQRRDPGVTGKPHGQRGGEFCGAGTQRFQEPDRENSLALIARMRHVEALYRRLAKQGRQVNRASQGKVGYGQLQGGKQLLGHHRPQPAKRCEHS
jgi:hypothetical protein